MSIFARIGAWFKAAFSKHNLKAYGMTVVRAAEVASDAAKGDLAGAAQEVSQVADAAKSVHVDGFAPGDSDATGHK